MPTRFPILIVDASSYLSQVYHNPHCAVIDRTVEYLPTYNFCRMLRKLVNKFNFAHIVIVWDGRKEIKPAVGYKAEKQIAMEIVDAMKMEQILQPNIPAYDIIFSMAKSFNDQHHNVVIVTNNRNMYGLVNDATTIFDPFAKILAKATIDQDYVEKKYKFPISQFPLFLALAGDTTGHIPGVLGIGEQRATIYAKKFNDLDEVYKNIQNFPDQKIRLALAEGKKDAYDSLDKALPHRHPNPTTVARTTFNEKNWQLVLPLFEKYGYKKLISEVQVMPKAQESIIERVEKLRNFSFELIVITTKEQLVTLTTAIKKTGYFSIDVQGSTLDPMTSNVVSVSIAINEKSVYSIPLNNAYHKSLITQKDLVAALTPVCADTSIEKIFRKAQFHLVLLEQIGLPINTSIFDTTIAISFVMHDWEHGSLEKINDFYVKQANLSYQSMYSNHDEKRDQIAIDQKSWNSVADTHQSLTLRTYLVEALKKEQVLKNFQTIEMPISHILAKMEITGIACDQTMLQKFDVQLAHDIDTLVQEINTYSKKPININSIQQIRELLFETLKLPVQRKLAKTRCYSTDANVLTELSAVHRVPGLILKYRELYKLQRPYVESLLQTINQKTNKIHPIWEHALGITDRISATHPNIQSIPTHAQDSKTYIRSAFHTDDHHAFIAADYHELELRIVAHLSQDKALKAALAKSDDIHTQIAAKLFSTTENKVTPEQRAIAKKINLSISYGLTAYGLAKDQNILYRQAAFAIKTFFTQFPGVRAWINSIIEKTQNDRYITTMFGRKKYVPNIRSKNRTVYNATVRIAINAIVQGSASEIVKIGMINLCNALTTHKLSSQLIINLHDQLVVIAHQSEIEKTKTIALEALIGATHWDIPLKVNLLTGHTWQDVTVL